MESALALEMGMQLLALALELLASTGKSFSLDFVLPLSPLFQEMQWLGTLERSSAIAGPSEALA